MLLLCRLKLRLKLVCLYNMFKLSSQQVLTVEYTVNLSLDFGIHIIYDATLLYRKCEQNQVFFKSNDPRPYCKNSCEPKTMCGEVQVPEDHLDVCRVCNSFGQDCKTQATGNQEIQYTCIWVILIKCFKILLNLPKLWWACLKMSCNIFMMFDSIGILKVLNKNLSKYL